jgi:putative heme-binding domain-containing protein
MVDTHKELGINPDSIRSLFLTMGIVFLPDENWRIMLSLRTSYRLIATLLLCGVVFSAPALQAQDDSLEDDFKTGPTPGQLTFASTCAGCHGLDGRGSEKAPNIAGNAKVQHLTDTQLSEIISSGVPGTGMPPFRSLSPAQVRALVAYLHLLEGKVKARALPGDASSGRKIFFGKGECSTCHTISGEGGFLGPDLSAYGPQMSAEAILKALTGPARIVPSGYKPATVTTRDGSRVEGVVRNEDNFSVQLQTRDGTFLFLQKSDLLSMEYGSQSLMPANYGERLSRSELNDLVSFLMSAGSPSKTPVSGQP